MLDKDVHVKLPSNVMARLRHKMGVTGIPVSILVRASVMDDYGDGVDTAPGEVTNPAQGTRNLTNESTYGD